MTKSDVKYAEKGEYTLGDLPDITYFNQMNTMLETEEEAERIVLKIEEKYKNILTPLQNGECIDIVPFGVNKANGIYELLKVIGCEYDDVITVGDNINDTHMIKEFRSYAMESGVDYIKSIANYITTGITELIETELGVKIDE
jgi:hydroxymethylpyrimidine pyrophosphatase-like HAD family hydrolase